MMPRDFCANSIHCNAQLGLHGQKILVLIKTGFKKKNTSQCKGLNKLIGNLCTNQKAYDRDLC